MSSIDLTNWCDSKMVPKISTEQWSCDCGSRFVDWTCWGFNLGPTHHNFLPVILCSNCINSDNIQRFEAPCIADSTCTLTTTSVAYFHDFRQISSTNLTTHFTYHDGWWSCDLPAHAENSPEYFRQLPARHPGRTRGKFPAKWPGKWVYHCILDRHKCSQHCKVCRHGLSESRHGQGGKLSGRQKSTRQWGGKASLRLVLVWCIF